MKSLRKNSCLWIASCFLIIAPLTHAQVQTEATEPIAQSIFTTVMSPYCPGKLLSDCPSAKASELKHMIREELAQGRSKEDVLLKLQDEYGTETLRAIPETSGFGLLAWLVPALFLVGGLLLGFRVVAKLAKK